MYTKKEMRVKNVLLLIVLPFVLGIFLSFFPLLQKTYYTQLISPNAQNLQQQQQFVAKDPTIGTIFAKNHFWTATLAAQRKRTMIVTGDIVPVRSVNYQVVTRGDFTWPYQKTADVLRNADLTFINLETPLLTQCPVTTSGMVFCGDVRNVDGLVFAGVDLASLANNHAGNHGAQGVSETVQHLADKGIKTTGINGPTLMDIRGVRFAFLGYNDITKEQPGISNVDEKKIKQEIAEARKKADVVIVTMHWGVEYRAQPDARQKYLGHLAIDAGADLVIGNHPHWIQPIEFYKGKLITYAHGNFVFDQEWSVKTKQGVVGRYTFYDNKLVDVEYLPVFIQDYGQPHFLEGSDKQGILDEMKKQSEILRENG